MFLSRSPIFRLSTTVQTALLSLAVGYLAAVLMVKFGGIFGSLRGSRMYVEDDDIIQLSDGVHDSQLKNSLKLLELSEHANTVVHDDSVAKSMSNAVRVVCMVMTTSDTLMTNAKQVALTWGRRCTKLFFVSDKDDIVEGIPVVQIDRTSTTLMAFDHVFREHINDGDWFLQADDETYIIMENLRYFLSSLSSSDPIYFRHHFSAATQQGYLGAGSGYILSREALMQFGSRDSDRCSSGGDSIEDREMGRCLRSLGVRTGDSRDALGRSRFHCFSPETYIRGEFPEWYSHYNKKEISAGIDSMSDYSISFHFVDAEQFIHFEFYIYHLYPYGRIAGLKQLNRPPASPTVAAAAVKN